MKSRWGNALVVVLVLGASLLALSCKGKSNPAGPGTPADLTIDIVGQLQSNSYSPASPTVALGQTVSWHNTDNMTHSSTENNIQLWDTQAIGPGATSAPIHMNTAGTFPYHCAYHPNTMAGTLTVTP